MARSESADGAPTRTPTFEPALPLALIDADHQHNDRFTMNPDDLRELADSIRAHGLLQPVRVRADAGRFQLIFGHRRFQAIKLLGRSTIPAIVDDVSDAPPDAQMLAENLDRADPSHVETACKVQRLLNADNQTPHSVAALLNRTLEWVNHRIALANYDPNILEALHRREIKLGVADELALIRDPAQQSALLQAAIANGATVRQAAMWRMHANAAIGDASTAPTQDAPPPVLGPPPTILKACWICEEQHDITEMSQVCVCAECVRNISSQQRKTAQARP